MITWHARVYNLRKYRLTTAYCIKLGKSGTRRSPVLMAARYRPGPVSRIRRSPPPELPGASGQHGE
jgi:hypothetical protein